MRPRPSWNGLGLPALSALLLYAAFPPANFGWLAWVAFVPLLISLRDGGFWRGFRRGWWFGTLFFLANLLWLWGFVADWTGSSPLGAVPWLLLSLIEGLYIAVFAGVVSLGCRRATWGLLLAPPAWAATEHLRSVWPAGGFAWAQLSYSQWEHPLLLQPAGWAGTHFLGFAIVLVNVGIVYALWVERGSRVAAAVGVLFVAGVVASLVAFVGSPDARNLTVWAAQPALDVKDASVADWYPQFLRFKNRTLTAARGADLVVFPEAYQPQPPEDTASAPAPYVISGQRFVDGDVYQTAYGVTPGQATYSTLDKTRLVVFGEFVPFRGRLPLLEHFKVPGGDVTAAPPGSPLQVGDLRVGVAICFESLFPEVLRRQAAQGVDVLVVMTLDDWFAGRAGTAQHAAASVVRAVECAKPLVRSGSAGITMIVDRHGRIVGRLPEGEQAALEAAVGTTPREARPGPLHVWFQWLCYLALPAPLLGGWKRAGGSSRPAGDA
jgi:apolipoprotein N-acyltransferase